MDPFCDYYLCIRNGEADLVVVLDEDDGALAGYESVQKLEYWRALQWVAALCEVERSQERDDDLLALLSAVFLGVNGGAIGNVLPLQHQQRGLA